MSRQRQAQLHHLLGASHDHGLQRPHPFGELLASLAINDAFSLIWNHTFSSTLLNQARANAAGWRWNEVTDNPQEPFGLPEDNISNIGSV